MFKSEKLQQLNCTIHISDTKRKVQKLKFLGAVVIKGGICGDFLYHSDIFYHLSISRASHKNCNPANCFTTQKQAKKLRN